MKFGTAIAPALLPTDVAAVARVFREYADSLDISLDYQGFSGEMTGLPGDYAPPRGLLLLARSGNGTPIGCAGCRPLADARLCEMKRLFVAPAGRGTGLGRQLVRRLLAEATALGYSQMRLDTLATMHAAQSLYRAEGFTEMAPYYDTPVPNTVFMRRPLA